MRPDVKYAAPPLRTFPTGEGGVLGFIVIGTLTSIFSFVFFLSTGLVQAFLWSVLTAAAAMIVTGFAIAAVKHWGDQNRTTSKALPISE